MDILDIFLDILLKPPQPLMRLFFIPAFDVIFQSMLQALLKHHKVDYEEEDTLQDEV